LSIFLKRNPTMARPKCYTCQYRGTIPGDCHSRCRHPLVEAVTENAGALGELASLLASSRRAGVLQASIPFEAVRKAMGVKGNPHGIAEGWFQWPINFDPTWLESCNGRKEKE
jgi:hypothetical protein